MTTTILRELSSGGAITAGGDGNQLKINGAPMSPHSFVNSEFTSDQSRLGFWGQEERDFDRYCCFFILD